MGSFCHGMKDIDFLGLTVVFMAHCFYNLPGFSSNLRFCRNLSNTEVFDNLQSFRRALWDYKLPWYTSSRHSVINQTTKLYRLKVTSSDVRKNEI